ncbi:MAG: Uma2 family endonuclease [Candidatus Rokubacteria bacterium]|nr:Uma2 family endonuclease [Candidatus Rokubacteria bacterium]
MATPLVRTRRWTRLEYERLVELGVFEPGERLELLDGRLVLREPQGVSHAAGIRLAENALRAAFGAGWEIRGQLPVALDSSSEPEPDVAVVHGSTRDYLREHPSRPVLVVEVAETSLAIDRRKSGLYARAGVPEVWIVNLVEGLLETYRTPAPSPRARFGWAYTDVRRLGRSELVTPLAAPTARIAVSDLVP